MSNWSPQTLSLILTGFFGPLVSHHQCKESRLRQTTGAYEAVTRRMTVFLHYGVYYKDVDGFELGSPLDDANGGEVGYNFLIAEFVVYYFALALVTIFILFYGQFVTLSQNANLSKTEGVLTGGAHGHVEPGLGQGSQVEDVQVEGGADL